jgi:hypothetical protein
MEHTVMDAEHYTHLFLFKDLSPEQLDLLYPLFTRVKSQWIQFLFEQGDLPESVAVSGVVVNFKAG